MSQSLVQASGTSTVKGDISIVRGLRAEALRPVRKGQKKKVVLSGVLTVKGK